MFTKESQGHQVTAATVPESELNTVDRRPTGDHKELRRLKVIP